MKACRSGEVSLNGVFARVVGQEVYLEGLYGRHSKLLMTRKEIDRLIGRLKGSNLTIVPLRLYFEKCWVKVDLGICRGKKNYDKRAAIKARDINRSAFLDMPENKRL